jgi:hypothetical protein
MNGAMMGGNGNSASPTSNLFPSITSLFQSPIGTPRVTPTPQHFAAYLFNEDQFHSLIFQNSTSSNGLSNSSNQNCNDAFLDAVLSNTSTLLSSQSTSNMINTFSNSDLSTNLSPLPLFNNLISNTNSVNVSTLASNNAANEGNMRLNLNSESNSQANSTQSVK